MVAPNHDGLGDNRSFRAQSKPKLGASYDDENECIRVVTTDCETAEEKISLRLTLIGRTHLGDGQSRYIGFVINSIPYLTVLYRLNTSGVVSITELVNAMFAESSNPQMRAALREVCLPILQENQIDQCEVPKLSLK